MSDFLSKANGFFYAFSLLVVLFLTSCSDDNNNSEVGTKTAEIKKSIVGNNKNMTTNKLDDKNHYKEMSQPIDKASWVEKGKFKKEFTKDCIGRELSSAGENKFDRNYIEKTCQCIADYMDEHLTDQEAEEFLGEDNHMRALQIRYDTAAYKCVQTSTKVEEPKITKFR